MMLKEEWTWKERAENLDLRLTALEKPKLDPAVIKSQAAAAQIENAANARTDVRTLVDLTAFVKSLLHPEELGLYASKRIKDAARKALGLK
jgi:hypothetical protein